MKRTELLQATRELDEQYEAGHLSLEEYQAARLLLSSQFDTLPSFMQGMPAAPTLEHKHYAKTAPYPAFSQHDPEHRQAVLKELAVSDTTLPLSPSHHTLVSPPSRHPPTVPGKPSRTPTPTQDAQALLGELLAALKDLNQLHQMGILSDQEFNSTKTPILERIRKNFASNLEQDEALEKQLPEALLLMLAKS